MGIPASRLEEIMKPKAYKEFCYWMTGQTTGLHNGKIHIFETDLLRWIRKRKVIG